MSGFYGFWGIVVELWWLFLVFLPEFCFRGVRRCFAGVWGGKKFSGGFFGLWF